MSLVDILESVGLPFAYRQWKKPPTLPYILYYATTTDNFAADNAVYQPITNYDIELYSDDKDPTSEALIEAALTANDIFYDKLEAYIQSEEMFQVVYSIQI